MLPIFSGVQILVCFCYFVYIVLVILDSLFCVSVYHVLSLSLGYFPLISARILVPLDYTEKDTNHGATMNKNHAGYQN